VVLGPSAAFWEDTPTPTGDDSVSNSAMQYASSGGVTRTRGPQTMLAVNEGFEVHSRVPRGLPALLTTGMNRQGARMGLTLWTPLAR